MVVYRYIHGKEYRYQTFPASASSFNDSLYTKIIAIILKGGGKKQTIIPGILPLNNPLVRPVA